MAINVSCPENDELGVCGLMESTGAGLGVLLKYLALSLPYILIVFALVGGVVVIIGAIAMVIRKGFSFSSSRIR